jgi:hypothetical protein
MLAWKLRVSVLWIFGALGNAAAMILLMFEPGAIRDLMAGEWLGADAHSGAVQVMLAVNLLVPVAMAYLTLVLGDVADRWTNGVVGAVAAVSAILSLLGLLLDSYGAGVVFVAAVESLVGIMIVWHAWKWPRSIGTSTTRRSEELTRLGA